jgi:tetratricopeptide (TPR) repeat protein
MPTYTLDSVQSMLRLSKRVIDGLMSHGFVSPRRGDNDELLFTFRDLVVLRAAHGLQEAKIPTGKILTALKRLRATLPTEMPLSGIRIMADGQEVMVRDGSSRWHAESGQLLLDFEVAPDAGVAVNLLDHHVKPLTDQVEAEYAQDSFNRGLALEENAHHDAAAAAYRQAIALAPDWVNPYLNLGAMLCEDGRCDEALAVYRDGVQHCPHDPVLHFNMGVALEDGGHGREALAAYEKSIELDGRLADAHFNAARLHEQFGDKMKAIRHFSAYKRLQG